MAGKDNPMNLLHLSGCPTGQELIPECEIVYEGESLDVKSAFEKCDKKSLHDKYIPVKDFDLHHLPKHLRTQRIKRLIELRCALTVRITVTYTSEKRPDKFADSGKPYPYSHVKGSNREKRFGTGIILLQESERLHCQCSCPACRNSEDPKGLQNVWILNVMTSTHVIYDRDEAVHSQFDCFFDSDDKQGVKTFYGVDFDKGETEIDFNLKSDLSEVVCAVHDEELMKRLWTVYGSNLDALFYPLTFPPEEVIVSHPHGGSKQISVGRIRYLTVPLQPKYTTDVPFPFQGDVICRLPVDVTPDVGENELDLESTRQLFRQHKDLFTSRTLDRILAALPTSETEIGLQILHRSLTSCLHMNCVFNLNVNSGGGDEGSLRTFYEMIKFLITQRLHNKKHPELIDIGFLLWWCFLACLLDYSDGFENRDLVFGNALPQTLTMCFTRKGLDKPYLGEILDIRGYLTEISAEDSFSSCQHSSGREMQVTLMRILTGNDAVSVDDENSKIFDILFYQILDPSYFTGPRDVHERLASIRKPSDDDYLQPGNGSQLPGFNTTFTLPSSAKYAYKIYKGDPSFWIFPPGTTFHFWQGEDRRIKLPIPDNTEFTVGLLDSNTTYYVNYSIATCSGSSGASVYLQWSNFQNAYFHVHSSGRMSHNRSGLTFHHGGVQDAKRAVQEFLGHVNTQ